VGSASRAASEDPLVRQGFGTIALAVLDVSRLSIGCTTDTLIALREDRLPGLQSRATEAFRHRVA
jgi:hypothetical protein